MCINTAPKRPFALRADGLFGAVFISMKRYAPEELNKLSNYLLDGRLELSNNRAERSIKPFVMGRNYALNQIMFCGFAKPPQ